MTFSIGGTSFVSSIIADTYEVNSQDEYTTWQDVRYTEHRTFQRSRVEGSFEMLFLTQGDYKAFLDALDSAKDGRTGAYKLNVAVNNTLSTKENLFYVDYELTRLQKAPMVDAFGQFTVTIRER